MVNKEMKFLDNGDIRYEIVDASARNNIQQINMTLDGKADASDVLAPLVGDADDITPQDVINALAEGRNASVTKEYTFSEVDWNLTFTAWNRVVDTTYSGNVTDLAISQTIAIFNGNFYLFEMVGGKYNGDMPWTITSSQITTAQELTFHYYDKDTIDNMMSGKSDKATTLSGYGIADAYTKTEVNNLVEGSGVTSVNGQTGTVTITASDLGAMTGMTILSYGHSTWDDFIEAYNANRIVYCKASTAADPASGEQRRMAFLAYFETNKTGMVAEFQYYRSVSSHTDAQQGDQVIIYQLKSNNTWSVTTRSASSRVVAGSGLSSAYASDTLTLSLNTDNQNKIDTLWNDYAINAATPTPESNVLLVTVTMSNEISGMADKSYAEVIEAWNAGKVVRLYANALGGEIDITARGKIGTTDEYFMTMLPMISGSQVGYMVVTMTKGATDSDMMSVALQF